MNLSRRSFLLGASALVLAAQIKHSDAWTHGQVDLRTLIATYTSVELWISARAITGVSNGATLTTANIRDQSIKNRGAATTATGLVYRSAGDNGLPAIEGNGSTGTLQFAGFNVGAAPCYFSCLTLPVGDPYANWILVDGVGAQGPSIGYGQQAGLPYGTFNGLSTYAQFSGTTYTNGIRTAEQGISTFLQATFNTTSSELFSNGSVVKALGTSPGTATWSNGVSFFSNYTGTGQNSNVQIQEAFILNNTATLAQRAVIRLYCQSVYQLPDRSSFSVCGDSITIGINPPLPSPTTQNWPYVMVTTLINGGSRRWRLHNFASSGIPIAQATNPPNPGNNDGIVLSYAPSHDQYWTGTYQYEIFHLQGGTNDYGFYQIAEATVLAAIRQWVTDRKADCAAVAAADYHPVFGVGTCFANGNGGFENTARLNNNTQITTNNVGADYYTDMVGAGSLLLNPADGVYYASDQTHLTVLGESTAAGYVNTSILAYTA